MPVAVGITYSLGRVTQRWLKDGMPTDMAPYADMMSEWKDKAREQVDRLRANPLKNIPLGDETVDYMKKWGNAAKDVVMEVKEKGQEAIQHVRHRDTLVEDVAAEKEQAAAATAEKEEAEKAVAAEEKSVEEQVRAAVEDAKIPLDE